MKLKKCLLALSILLLAACGNETLQDDEGQTFDLLTITPQDIELTDSYSASIRGKQDIRIIPRVDGYLTKIAIKEGAKVIRNQVLFEIDQAPFIAALRAAKANVSVCEANVANAQLSYDSKLALFKKSIVSDFDLNSAKNALKMAEAELEQAKAQEFSAENNLSYTEIKSPSDGVVGKLNYRIGDYVSSATQDGLTVVSDNTTMYVYFSMTEKTIMELMEKYGEIDSIITQMPDIKLQLSSKNTYNKTGRIESISGVVDHTTGSVSVRAAFPNPKGQLLSGGAGSIIIPYIDSEAIIIPQEATFEIQDKTYAYKVVDGKTVSTIISVHKVNNGKEYIVTDGLEVGDIIIAKGAGLVQEGIIVKNKE